MVDNFICDCGIKIHYTSYYNHIKSKRHIDMLKLQITIKDLLSKNEILTQKLNKKQIVFD